jgi:hypothetical protein
MITLDLTMFFLNWLLDDDEISTSSRSYKCATQSIPKPEMYMSYERALLIRVNAPMSYLWKTDL